MLFFLPCFLHGQGFVFVLDTLKTQYRLNDYLHIWEDTTGTIPFETVSTPAFDPLFQPYNQVKPLPHLLGVYWGKILLTNHLREPNLLKNWFLRIGEGSYIDVYFADQDGNLREYQKTGELVPAREKKLATGNRVERVLFSLAMGDTAAIFIRLQMIDHNQPGFDVRLSQQDFRAGPAAFRTGQMDSFVLGFLAAIIIFSFLFFLTTRDTAFLFHALFLLSATIFMLDIFGIMPDLPVLRDHPKWALYLNYLALTCWDIFFLQFFRSYMQLEKTLPRWDQILKWMIRLRIGFFLAAITFFAVTFNEVLHDLVTISYVAVQWLVILFFLGALYRLKDPKAYFLILATLFFIAGVGVNACLIAAGMPVNRLFAEGAVFGEILLFSLGLGYRMQQLQEEEKEAHRLKSLDELKNHFFTNITHEFRTPLTLINGMVEQLAKKTSVHPERSLQLIRQNSDQLLHLVNRLLNLAKIESGHLQTKPAKGDLLAYLRQLVEVHHPLATRKEITLRFLTSLSSLEMDFDAEIIRQIFTNLLSNAIKFTPAKGSVSISIKKNAGSPDQVSIAVSDTGVGIPESELPQIFDRFYQSENTARQHGLGTGIGLALTRELVLLTGGQISVSSKLGEGTTFTVTLPVTQRAHPAGMDQTAIAPIPADDWQPEIPEAPLATTQPSNRNSGKNLVLVIEDNPHIVEFLRSLLGDSFEVEAAFNGKDGVEIALETIPDLIVSDVIMPEMDGFGVLDALKNDPRTSHIPIVLLTALASVKDRIDGLERGADAYLGKPFEGRELLAILNNLLEQRQRLQAFFINENNTPATQTESAPPEDPFLTTLKTILDTHLSDEDFGILQLQRAMAVSRTQLHRKLKALTGMSTTEFINYSRLQKAAELLRNPGLHISEIAYGTGFKDPNYFTRLFVKQFGKTPSDYRFELTNGATAA